MAKSSSSAYYQEPVPAAFDEFYLVLLDHGPNREDPGTEEEREEPGIIEGLVVAANEPGTRHQSRTPKLPGQQDASVFHFHTAPAHHRLSLAYPRGLWS